MTEKKETEVKKQQLHKQGWSWCLFQREGAEKGDCLSQPSIPFLSLKALRFRPLLFFSSPHYVHTLTHTLRTSRGGGKKTLVLDFGINYWFSFPYKFSIVSHYDMLAVCLWKESHSITERTCLSWEEEEKKTGSQSGDHKHWQADSSLLFCVNMINMLLVYISTISFKHIHIFSQIWISSLTLVCGAVPRQHGRPLTCNLSGHRNWKTRRTLTAQRARRPPLHLPLRSFIAEQQSSSINSHSCQWA